MNATNDRQPKPQEPQGQDSWLLEETCAVCQGWRTVRTSDDNSVDGLVQPQPRRDAMISLRDEAVLAVAMGEVRYRLRNIYTGETVSEEEVLKSLGRKSVALG